MTTLTPDALDGLQRFATITEFERTVFKEIPYRNVAAGTLAELVRLARLGLRLDNPDDIVTVEKMGSKGRIEAYFNGYDIGKRVALVVLEDSK